MERGITVPVVPGIMPVTSLNQLTRIVSISGNALPKKFVSVIEGCASDPDGVKKAGIAFATEQILDLFNSGFNAVHVYSMNKPDVAAAIQENVAKVIKIR